MANGSKYTSQRLKEELGVLVRLAKHQTGQDFNIKQSRQMLALFKWATQDPTPVVQVELQRLDQFVSPGHRRFFEQNGIFFGKSVDDVPHKTVG